MATPQTFRNPGRSPSRATSSLRNPGRNRRLTVWSDNARMAEDLPDIYLKRVKTLEAFYGSTAWHTENALRLAAVMADQTAHQASG